MSLLGDAADVHWKQQQRQHLRVIFAFLGSFWQMWVQFQVFVDIEG